MHVIRAVMKEPYLKSEAWIVKVRLLKSDLPKIAPMIGMIRSATKELRTAANATPMTKGTARVMRLPFTRKSLKSLRTFPTLPPAVGLEYARNTDRNRGRRFAARSVREQAGDSRRHST